MALEGWKIPWTGLTWSFTKGDGAAAREIIRHLEDRRLLFGVRSWEDERYCVLSALETRKFLTEVLSKHRLSKEMVRTVQAIRSAMRRFVETAGPDGAHFRHGGTHGPDGFSVALGELRSTVGLHVAVLANLFNLSVTPELASIIPPSYEDDDGAWAPGFESPV